jgi:hypothetical protein
MLAWHAWGPEFDPQHCKTKAKTKTEGMSKRAAQRRGGVRERRKKQNKCTYIHKTNKKNLLNVRCQWLMPIILAT